MAMVESLVTMSCRTHKWVDKCSNEIIGSQPVFLSYTKTGENCRGPVAAPIGSMQILEQHLEESQWRNSLPILHMDTLLCFLVT